jgi:predicted small metal-binding protein
MPATQPESDGEAIMKTMTCRQLGGPCDFALRGANADEVIKLQDSHLRSAVVAADHAHDDALAQMKGRWKHPIRSMGWYRDAKRDFAALPND